MTYFIAWMTLFPISASICNYIDRIGYADKKQYSGADNGGAVIIVSIWIYVGYLLFNH